jgi:hypothetical protein
MKKIKAKQVVENPKDIEHTVEFVELKSCDNCGIIPLKTFRCSACKFAKYCSKECQLSHWSEHKEICKTYKALPLELREMMLAIDRSSTSLHLTAVDLYKKYKQGGFFLIKQTMDNKEYCSVKDTPKDVAEFLKTQKVELYKIKFNVITVVVFYILDKYHVAYLCNDGGVIDVIFSIE